MQRYSIAHIDDQHPESDWVCHIDPNVIVLAKALAGSSSRAPSPSILLSRFCFSVSQASASGVLTNAQVSEIVREHLRSNKYWRDWYLVFSILTRGPGVGHIISCGPNTVLELKDGKFHELTSAQTVGQERPDLASSLEHVITKAAGTDCREEDFVRVSLRSDAEYLAIVADHECARVLVDRQEIGSDEVFSACFATGDQWADKTFVLAAI